MTFDFYQQQARRTQNDELMTEQKENHALHGLSSEVGEIHSIYQKVYQGHEMNYNKVIDEAGDLLWFLSELADCIGTTLDHIAQHNIDKLRKRYPEGFDADRSLHRNGETA